MKHDAGARAAAQGVPTTTPATPAGAHLSWLLLWLALAIELAVTVIDIAIGGRVVLIGLPIVPVVGLAVVGTPRQVGIAGTAAIGIAALSGLWNASFGAQYGVRLLIVCLAAGISALFALRRSERETAFERARAELVRAQFRVDQLQAGLLPPRIPTVEPWAIAARFRAGASGVDVGGDFYVVIPNKDGLVIMLGDVTGKGIAAAVVGTSVRHSARAIAYLGHGPSTALRTLNDLLLAGTALTPVTLVASWITTDPKDGCSATIVCAGHPLPYRLLASGAVEQVGQPGTLLGALPSEDCDWPTVRVRLDPKECLFFYSDGLTEAGGPRLRLGEDRLQRLLVHAPRDPESLLTTVVRELVRFESVDRRDDVAMIAVQYPGTLVPDAVDGG
jgi:serine phosphatase RsbU (regulator of sigma subunit)